MIKLRQLFIEDWEHEKRIIKIMENADSLKGKEFIDFLLNFLQGKMGEADSEEKKGPKLPKYCKLELSEENAKKLREVLKD